VLWTWRWIRAKKRSFCWGKTANTSTIRDRASDSVVATGDERNLVPQLPATDIITGAGFWLWSNPVFAAGLPFLMLRGRSFFSFGMVRIIRFSTSFQMFSPFPRIALKEIFIFLKKIAFPG
jgi:hypothetical protein